MNHLNMTNLVKNHEETVMKIYNFFNKRKYVYIYTVPCSYILWTKAHVHVLIDCASRSRLHTDEQFLKSTIASFFSMNSNICYWVTYNDMYYCSSRKFLWHTNTECSYRMEVTLPINHTGACLCIQFTI